MFPIESNTERILFTTTRIATTFKDQPLGSGTGFFYESDIDEKNTLPLVITNNHVLEGADACSFQLHESTGDGKPSGKFLTIGLDGIQNYLIRHPNPDIDLCAIPLAAIILGARNASRKVFRQSLIPSFIKTDEELESLRAVEDALMIGYPIGLWDEKHNLPLVRKGITATHPAVDFNGRSITVIDMACWPGSSGSPVLIVDGAGGFVTKEGNTIIGSKRVIFLGVLSSGPKFTATGDVVTVPAPMQSQQVAETGIHINLGYIIKAKEILSLVEAVLEKNAQKKQLSSD